MTPELHVLNDILRQCPPESLWCADENTAGFTPASFRGCILTNRFDIYQHLQKTFVGTAFNDFDFRTLSHPVKQLVFRIAKEKALNLHIIRQAFAHLQAGDRLFLLGYKNEGINSLGNYINNNFAADIRVHKHKAQLQCIEVIIQANSPALPPDDYALLQQVNSGDLAFFSKPGVFGWNKIDKGSQLLMDAMEKPEPGNQKQLLDLGCGYGYLAIRAWQMGFQHIDATDNNAAAILACRQNFTALGISGEVFAANQAEGCRKKYDIILCNPPFHQGFEHSKNLTGAFVQQAYALLKPHGEAYFVVNQFIGIEKIAASLFSQQVLLGKAAGFKLLLFKKN